MGILKNRNRCRWILSVELTPFFADINVKVQVESYTYTLPVKHFETPIHLTRLGGGGRGASALTGRIQGHLIHPPEL